MWRLTQKLTGLREASLLPPLPLGLSRKTQPSTSSKVFLRIVLILCFSVHDHMSQNCKFFSTAPAGYTCPCCSSPIFPPDNLVSPVADKLRQILQVFCSLHKTECVIYACHRMSTGPAQGWVCHFCKRGINS